MNTIKIDKYFKGMVASQGLSGIETENTIFAFLAASNRSYYGISCDVNISKDHELIAINDDTLLRLGLLNLDILSFNYDELKKFSLIDRKTSNLDPNLFVPKLKDFMAICKAYRKQAFIRLTHHIKSEHLHRILEIVNDFDYLKHSHFITDNRKHLQTLAKQVDTQHLFYDVLKLSTDDLDFCKNKGFNLHADYQHLSVKTIKELKLIGLKVSTGIINDKETAERLIKHDVDLVFTSILE